MVKPQLSQNYVFFLEKTPLEAFLSPRGLSGAGVSHLSVRCNWMWLLFSIPSGLPNRTEITPEGLRGTNKFLEVPQKRIQKRWGANVRLEGVAFLVFLDDTSFQTLRIGLRHCYLQCFLQYSKKSIFAIQT